MNYSFKQIWQALIIINYKNREQQSIIQFPAETKRVRHIYDKDLIEIAELISQNPRKFIAQIKLQWDR